MLKAAKTTEILVKIKNKPGELARLLGVIAAGGMNVIAYMAQSHEENHSLAHLVAEDSDLASRLLQTAGYSFITQEVICIEKRNHVGSEVEVTRRLGAANVNICHAYATATGEGAYISILRTNDNDAAIKALTQK
ncbi:MAG: hypothetical protein NTX50_21980 [Candidatus Sumerlaeota bacterium]|nr:hypothetical protein [Candidatus Sumerlaeota bacterium]